MQTFVYTVRIEAGHPDEAAQVMAERLEPEEDYGFDYALTYEREPLMELVED